MPSAIDQLKNAIAVSRETLAARLTEALDFEAAFSEASTWRQRWTTAWSGVSGFIKTAVETFRGVEGFAGSLKREFVLGQVGNLLDVVLPLIPLGFWGKALLWLCKPGIRWFVLKLAGAALEAFYANPT